MAVTMQDLDEARLHRAVAWARSAKHSSGIDRGTVSDKDGYMQIDGSSSSNWVAR